MESNALDARQSTATQAAPQAPAPATGGSILNQTSALRDGVQVLNEDVAGLHQTALEHTLDEKTTTAAMRAPSELLRELARDYGLSWALIARLTRVSPTAVRKWRRGESISADSRRALARAVSFLEMTAQHASPIADPASWIEMPLSDQATITPVDIYEADRADLLFEVLSDCMGPHDMLDQFDPNWRSTYALDGRFEIAEAADGLTSIVEKV